VLISISSTSVNTVTGVENTVDIRYVEEDLSDTDGHET
jgi:hypothetical protein